MKKQSKSLSELEKRKDLELVTGDDAAKVQDSIALCKYTNSKHWEKFESVAKDWRIMRQYQMWENSRGAYVLSQKYRDELERVLFLGGKM